MRPFNRYPTLRRVIVNLKTERAFRGLVWARRGGYLILKNAELLKSDGGPVAMDGEVAIDETNIDFMQVLT